MVRRYDDDEPGSDLSFAPSTLAPGTRLCREYLPLVRDAVKGTT